MCYSVTHLALTPSQTGSYSIWLPMRDGRLSWRLLYVVCETGWRRRSSPADWAIQWDGQSLSIVSTTATPATTATASSSSSALPAAAAAIWRDDGNWETTVGTARRRTSVTGYQYIAFSHCSPTVIVYLTVTPRPLNDYESLTHLVVLVVQRFGVGLVIERSLVQLPAGALSSHLTRSTQPSIPPG